MLVLPLPARNESQALPPEPEVERISESKRERNLWDEPEVAPKASPKAGLGLNAPAKLSRSRSVAGADSTAAAAGAGALPHRELVDTKHCPPAARRISADAASPSRAAKSSAELPPLSRRFTSAPPATSTLTASAEPLRVPSKT